ncbi:hypothetical protein [Umezawaea sp.]|uniref:hypothetical protein n=1 Tax=Umezawaea sp. TaxID=1955258 RepID=UPI002ED59099
MELTSWVLVGSTASGAAAVVSTAYALLRGGSAATRHLAAGVALLTTALFVQAAPARTFTFGSPHLAWTLQHVAALGAAYLVPSGFARVVEGSQDGVDRFPRPRLALLWVALAVVVGCFAARPHASDWLFSPAGRYEAGGPGDPFAALAHATFGAYLARAVAAVIGLSRRTARLARAAGRGRVATGMLVHAWGEVPILVFALHVVADNTALLFGVVPPWPEAAVDQVLMPFGTCLLLLGLAIARRAAGATSGASVTTGTARSSIHCGPGSRGWCRPSPTPTSPRQAGSCPARTPSGTPTGRGGAARRAGPAVPGRDRRPGLRRDRGGGGETGGRGVRGGSARLAGGRASR